MKDSQDTPKSFRKEQIQLRHQIVGAVVLLLIAAALWRLGDSPPPPPPAAILEEAEMSQVGEDWRPAAEIPAAATPASVAPVVVSVAKAKPKNPAAPDKGQPAKTAAAKKDYKLVVGVFSEKENRERLIQKLKAANFAVAAEQTDKGVAVYVVGLPSPQALAAAKKRVEKITQKPVAKPTKTAAAKPTKPTKATAGGRVFQIAAYRDKKRTQRAVAKLKQAGFVTRVAVVKHGGADFSRVQIILPANESLQAARQKLKKMGYDNLWAVKTL